MNYGEFLRSKMEIAKDYGFCVSDSDISSVLKPHQRDAVRWAIKGGRRALFESFGLGKTIQELEFCRIVTEKKGGKALIVLPLGVKQEFAHDAVALLGMPAPAYVRTMAEVEAAAGSILITNYERVRDGDINPQYFTATSLDEASCFPKGTLIDTPSGKIPIDMIRLCDVISNAGGTDYVRALHKNHVKRVARVNLAGDSILASYDHRFFTRRGWVIAGELQPGDSLMETAEAVQLLRSNNTSPVFRGRNEAVLQSILLSEMANGTAGCQKASVGSSEKPEQDTGELAETPELSELRTYHNPPLLSGGREAVLQPNMLFGLARNSSSTYGRSSQETGGETVALVEKRLPGSIKTDGSDKEAESDVKATECRENEAVPCGKDISIAGREQQIDKTATTVVRDISQCPDGISDLYSTSEAPLPIATELLQGRHCDPASKDSYRGGWKQPQNEEVAISGQAQDGGFERSRVVSVEILESGHPDLDKYRDADGQLYFYDLSATQHPSYSVNGFLVHNCLRSYGSKTYQTFLSLFKGVPFKLVATATPSPNKFKELIHYAGYLEIMDTGQALTRFFQRDSTKANNLTIYPHKENEFWLWVSTWALYITKPSDLGYDDAGYDLPKMNIHYHEIPVDHLSAGADKWGQVKMFREAATGLKDAAKEKRDSIDRRIETAMEIIGDSPDDHFILWHDLESERHAIKKALPAATEIFGTQDLDIREQRIMDFSAGKLQYLATKPELSGQGCNFQYHCHKSIFLGIGYKFNDFIQAIHRILRYQQTFEVDIHIIYTESEREVLKTLLEKWQQHDYMVERMIDLIKKHGLSSTSIMDKLSRSMGVERVKVEGRNFAAINNDCIVEAEGMPENSVDLIHTSIPFSNHYEYTPSYNDFGHNENTARFFEQMDFLTPQLLRILKPGRVFACHVKDRVLFGNATGTGMPTIEPFHVYCVEHYIKHGFQYFGMITVVTDVVRENNQTYRLGWTECTKDGSKMGVGCPEYILLFRKLPSDTSTARADVPVAKTKEEYTRAQWQIDAHAYWRSSGDRLMSKEELKEIPTGQLQAIYRKYSRGTVYSYEDHVALAKKYDTEGRLPASFMVVAPGSWTDDVWDDINRMRTLNGEQSRKGIEMHVCPLQFDIVERIINRYSNSGEVVFDPFAGLFTVPMVAVRMGRKGIGIELSADYFRDGVGYLQAAEREVELPSLFDVVVNE